MCARLTVLSDTPIAAAIAGWALTQQHHLDALALRCCYLPAKGSFPRLASKNTDSSRYGGGISDILDPLLRRW
jgi:hypothetical protein